MISSVKSIKSGAELPNRYAETKEILISSSLTANGQGPLREQGRIDSFASDCEKSCSVFHKAGKPLMRLSVVLVACELNECTKHMLLHYDME